MSEERLRKLQQRAKRQTGRLERTLAEIEAAKAEALSPEERRRRFRVIPGGAAVAGLAWAWAWLHRPEPALAVLTAGLLGLLVVGPPLEPGNGTPRPVPPVTLPELPPAPIPAPSPSEPAPDVVMAEPRSAPAPVGPPLAPPPAPVPSHTPTPGEPVPPSPQPPPEPPGLCVTLNLLDLRLCLDDILGASPQDRDAPVPLKIV